jgi:raffinose/stachyose/melibiose transport system substrate-binding protein
MVRRPARALLITSLVCVLAAIGVVGATASSGAKKDTTLTLLLNSRTQPAFNILIPNFERVYPDIKVEATYASSFPLAQLMRTQLQAGNAADVLMTQTSYSTLNSTDLLAQGNYLLDLSKRPWVKRVPNPAKPFVSVKAKTYGWVLDENAHPLIVNIDLFNQLGLKQPTTFAGLLALCHKATAAGKYLINSGWALSGLQYFMINAFVLDVDQHWAAKRKLGKVTFAGSPLWHTAFKRFQELKDNGCLEPQPQASSLAASVAAMAQGKAVMLMSPASGVSFIRAAAPTLKTVFMPFPADKAQDTKLNVIYSDALSINAASKQKDAAMKFVDFMARPKQSTLYAKVAGTIAPFDATRGVFPAAWNLFKPLIKAKKVIPGWSQTLPSPDATIAMQNAWLGVATGQSSVDDALASVDAAYKVVFGK